MTKPLNKYERDCLREYLELGKSDRVETIKELIYRLLDQVKALEKRDQRWKDIMNEELGCTLELFDALGIDKSILDNMPEGQTTQGMLIKHITTMREQVETLEERLEIMRDAASEADLDQ